MVPQHSRCCPTQAEAVTRRPVTRTNLLILIRLLVHTAILLLLSALVVHQRLSSHTMEQLIQAVFPIPTQCVVIALRRIVGQLDGGGSGIIKMGM